MHSFNLKVSIDSIYGKLRSELIECATWQQVEDALMLLRAPNSGSVDVVLMPRSSKGASNLQVFAEANAFYLMLGEDIELNGELDFDVRTYCNSKGRSGKKIEIGGYEWPEAQVCFEFNTVLMFFSDFCHSGDVFDDRLS